MLGDVPLAEIAMKMKHGPKDYAAYELNKGEIVSRRTGRQGGREGGLRNGRRGVPELLKREPQWRQLVFQVQIKFVPPCGFARISRRDVTAALGPWQFQ